MDGFSILVGVALGAALGGGLGYLIAAARSRGANGAGGAAEQVAVLSARLAAADAGRQEALESGRAERDRAEVIQQERAEAERKLAALTSTLTERERAMRELVAQQDQAREKLLESFKAAGADVLRATSVDFLKQAAEQFSGQRKLADEAQTARERAMNEALRPLHEQAVKSEALVRELGQKREGDAKQLAEQLKQIGELQLKASVAAQTLGSALRDTRQRGKWGEVGLRTIVELAGLEKGIHFVEQQSVEGDDGRLRPDMIVNLPGGRVIPIDSKVPLDAYLDSLQPDIDDSRRSELRANHAAALRTHIRSLASKNYSEAVEADIECTVLYMPLESAFLAAQEADHQLFMEAMERRVFVACPGTLMPLLRTVAMNWGNADAENSAREVRDLAVKLLKCAQTLADHVDKTGTGLESALKGYNGLVGSLQSRFLPALKQVAGIAKVEPVEIEGTIDITPRQPKLPESAAHE